MKIRAHVFAEGAIYCSYCGVKKDSGGSVNATCNERDIPNPVMSARIVAIDDVETIHRRIAELAAEREAKEQT